MVIEDKRESSINIIERVLSSLTDVISKDYNDVEKAKRNVFDIFLSSYEGYNIIEVICRESAAFLFQDYVELNKIDQLEFDIQKKYLDKLIYTSKKYSYSENWPEEEKRRAQEFLKLVESTELN